MKTKFLLTAVVDSANRHFLTMPNNNHISTLGPNNVLFNVSQVLVTCKLKCRLKYEDHHSNDMHRL